jgi:twinkle protein
MWSPEMQASAQVARLVQQMTGVEKPSRAYFEHVVKWLGGRVFIYQKAHKVTTDEIRGIALFAQRRLGVTQVVIDSLVKVYIPSAKDHLLAQTALADDLACLARDSGLCINLVCHARKGDKESDRLTKFDLKGSGAIVDMADACFIVSRNVRKHEEQKRAKGEPTDYDDQPDGYMECVKNRHRSEMPLLPLWFNATCNQFTRQQGKRMTMRSLRDFSDAPQVM